MVKNHNKKKDVLNFDS